LQTKIEKKRLERLVHSKAYIRAYEDVKFLGREDLRPVRLQLELQKPELMLQEQGIKSTIVVFGSTRTVERREMEPVVKRLEKRHLEAPRNGALKRELAVAKRLLAKSRFYDEAREFARLVSATCQVDGRCDYVVVTGGGPGIMEAANRGAFDVGAKTIGLNITLPHEQFPNQYITPELCFQFHYFALRKMHFMMRAKAMVIFPGGYGTLDELFEALTLVQTGKTRKMPIILVHEPFWRGILDWFRDRLVAERMIDAKDMDLISVHNEPEQVVETIFRHYENRAFIPSPAERETFLNL